MKGIEDLFKCPFGDVPTLSHYRVEGGEDEAQPFTILCDCDDDGNCKFKCHFSATYGFDRGLKSVSCDCKRFLV